MSTVTLEDKSLLPTPKKNPIADEFRNISKDNKIVLLRKRKERVGFLDERDKTILDEKALARHYSLPPEREQHFALALSVLAEDARSTNPHWLPELLAPQKIPIHDQFRPIISILSGNRAISQTQRKDLPWDGKVVYLRERKDRTGFINKNATTPLDEKALARHYGVPPEREQHFALALSVLAEDARSTNPRWLPELAALAQRATPGTTVTQPTPAPSLDFPKVAPEKWVPRGEEMAGDFAVRVYGQWMKPDNTGISMAEILNLDETLYHAVRRLPPSKKPEGFFLPTKSERNQATIRLIQEGNLPVPEDYTTRNRLTAAAWRTGQSLMSKS